MKKCRCLLVVRHPYGKSFVGVKASSLIKVLDRVNRSPVLNNPSKDWWVEFRTLNNAKTKAFIVARGAYGEFQLVELGFTRHTTRRESAWLAVLLKELLVKRSEPVVDPEF